MLTNITLGQYFPGQTFIHKLDPRSKILLTLVFIIMIFITTAFSSYIVLFAFFLMLVMVAKLNFAIILRSVKPLWPIILITMLVHMFSNKGQVLYTLWIFDITKEGIMQGLLMSIRIIFLILFSSLLTMTTSPLQLTDAIERLLNPFKKFGLPAHELAMMMTIALRFIPTLLMETERIMMAQTARGAQFQHGSLIKKIKNFLSIIVPLFLSAFRRADELAIAMQARCYNGGQGRTRLTELKMGIRDTYATVIVFVVSATMLVAKWYVQ